MKIEVMASAVQAGKLLGERLAIGHDRPAVTQPILDKRGDGVSPSLKNMSV